MVCEPWVKNKIKKKILGILKGGKLPWAYSHHYIILTITKNCSYYEHSMVAIGQVCPHRLVVRTSLFQGDCGDSNSPGGRVLQKGVAHGLSISLELILPGSMPEWLMGTDCKFVGNMSTLVQIQLGPKICRSIMRWYTIFSTETSDTEE